MNLGFTRSVLVRAAVAVLALSAPALSGCTKTDYAKQQEAHQNEFKVIDDGLIQAYLTRHNITQGTGLNQYQRLNESANDGIYIVKVSEGTGTTNIVSGQQVDVKYVGRYLRESNETVIFDNSADRRVPCGCISFTVGASQVIKGWDQGLLQMKKGDRRLLLIPSYLAYGPTGSGSIPPDEPLLFDMEVVEVR